MTNKLEDKLEDNPKKRYGDKKPPISQMPLSAMAHASMAFMDGSLKYGFRNWRDQPVEARTYIDAAMRHMQLWAEGEEYARDTKVHNLGAVIACASILIDAAVNNALIDNRHKSQASCDLLHALEMQVDYLKEMQKAQEPVKVVNVDAVAKYTNEYRRTPDLFPPLPSSMSANHLNSLNSATNDKAAIDTDFASAKRVPKMIFE
jgi:hypothetical protein